MFLSKEERRAEKMSRYHFSSHKKYIYVVLHFDCLLAQTFPTMIVCILYAIIFKVLIRQCVS